MNWTREKSALTAFARVLMVSVLATPGTPSRRTWPLQSRARRSRSTRVSWPTTTVATRSRMVCRVSDIDGMIRVY